MARLRTLLLPVALLLAASPTLGPLPVGPAHADFTWDAITGRPVLPPAYIDAQLSAVARLRRVNRERAGCTAVLITPQAVLTAGHCAGAPSSVTRMVIFPGPEPYRVEVTSRQRHPIPVPNPPVTLRDYRTDVAILHLAAPVPPDVATPMPLAAPDPTLPHAVYGFDNWQSPDVVRGHDPCTLVVRAGAPHATDCYVVNGQSGGALIRFTDDGPRLVGILVAQINGDSPLRSIAAPLEPDHWPALAEVLSASGLASDLGDGPGGVTGNVTGDVERGDPVDAVQFRTD